MSCAFDKEKLTGYYDGELESAEKADIERHISACSECLRELGEIKSAAILVKELPRRRAPRSIAEGVSREIAAAGRVHRFDRWRRGLLWGTAAAAAVFVALNVAYFARVGEREAATPVASSPRPENALGTSLREAPMKGPAPAQEKLAEKLQTKEDVRRQDDGVKNADALRALVQREEQNRREGERERAAAAPEPAAAPAPAKALPAADLEKKLEAAKRAEPPPAPPAAAPRPEAPVAKAPSKPEAFEKDKEAGKGADLHQEGQLRRQTVAPAHVQWTIASLDVPRVRARVEELARKWSGTNEKADRAHGFGTGRGAAPGAPITLELTKAQVEELQKEIGKQSGVSLVIGAPDDPLTYRVLGGVKKDAATAAPGAAAKTPAPAPAPAEPAGGALAKGKDMKQAYDPKAEEARKQLAEAESRAKAKESPRDANEETLKKVQEQKVQQGAAGPAGQAPPEPLQKVILHFLEVPK